MAKEMEKTKVFSAALALILAVEVCLQTSQGPSLMAESEGNI